MDRELFNIGYLQFQESSYYILFSLCQYVKSTLIGSLLYLSTAGSHQTCLHLASRAGNLEVARNLVANGHDILLKDIHGLNPFHYALKYSCLDVLQYMSEARESELSQLWHSLDDHGRSPLHHHVSSVLCYVDAVDFLIQCGCEANKPDAKGNSCLSLCGLFPPKA